MTQIRIKLTADNFRTLVSGGEVTFDEGDILRSKGVTLTSGVDDRVVIILEDMGWPHMAAMIKKAWDESNSSDAAEASVKPQYGTMDFDECECGDYRQDHDPDTGRCRKSHNRANGMRPCLAFKLVLVATEIPEGFRSR